MKHVACIALVAVFAGCVGIAPLARSSGAVAGIETRIWRDEILRRGQDGDWLVIRGYNSADHLVAIAGNSDFSHVGVLNARNARVVEAVSPVVREIALQEFLEGAERVVLIRPDELRNPAFSSQASLLVTSPQFNRGAGSAALTKARSQIGAPYDRLGTIGLPESGKFYCTELAAWSVGRTVDVEGLEKVLHPADMSQFGQILFDSQSRTRE